jgi:SAM-dependent methyltransferase
MPIFFSKSSFIKYVKSKRRNYFLQAKFKNDLDKFKILSKDRFTIEKKDLYPCLNDNTNYTSFDAHYIYHPAWATRIIKKINPQKHVDISSTLHFCSTISAFFETEFYDYRPAKLNLSGLNSGEADLNSLNFETNSIECISCMHTIEHIGLGRYGDKLDPDGDLNAIKELQRVTKIGGNLLLVVPVGKPRIQFNAHRIYSFEMIQSLFYDFQLKDFSLITDDQVYIENADSKLVEHQSYGCGCFWFQKIR